VVVQSLQILENLAAPVLSWALSTLFLDFICHVLMSIGSFFKTKEMKNKESIQPDSITNLLKGFFFLNLTWEIQFFPRCWRK